MNHIHISIVGKETMPIYNVIKTLKPDKVFLICSDGERGTIAEYNTIVSKFNDGEYKFRQFIVDPINLNEIYKSIELIKQEVSEEDYLTLNLTGGTKFWAFAFYLAFEGRNYTQFYLCNQNNVLWNIKSNESANVDGLDIDILMSLYGNEKTVFKKFNDYTSEDYTALKKIEQLRSFNFVLFNNLAAVLDKKRSNELKNNKSGEFSNDNGDYILWSKPNKVEVRFSHKKRKPMEVIIESPNAVSLMFNSGWFEYKVAKILSDWSQVKDIRMNCVFPLHGNIAKNEVDIIVTTKIKPIFVECKTLIHSSTDVDKFTTVVNNYGGSACKALFITDQPMPEMAAVKCKESNVHTFCLKGHSKDDLYKLLDSILLESNK